MRLLSAALAVALTPVFIALPTVSFAAADKPRPVAPSVTSTPIRGIDAKSAAALAPATSARVRPGAAGPKSMTASRELSVLTGGQERKRFTVAGVSWAASTDLTAADVTVQVRVKEDSGWTAWETLAVPDDGPETATAEAVGARLGTTPLVSEGATGIQVRVDTPAGRTLPDLKVTTIDPGTSPADDNLTAAQPPAAAAAAATTPTIITRAQWGADESLRGSKTLNSAVKAIVIHHTAGTNSYTQATAAAQVRGIYAYDTKGLGWADIAYNFLVDKWGRVYEGRAGSITQAVRGAHAMGFNTDTMGISAMGNYETASAPAAMVDSMAKVAGWKLSQYGVNPLGTTRLTSQGGTGAKYGAGVTVTLPTINAHQNTSYTLCPGKYLYAQMGTIRSKAALYAQYSSTSAPAVVPTARLYATYGSLTLKQGSTGWAVRDLQVELNRRGFTVGTPDGDFGPMTTAAVIAIQKAAHLDVTGQVTPNDWKALSNLPHQKASSTPTPPATPPPPPTPPTPPTSQAPVPGFDADGEGDVMGRTGSGLLYSYPTGVGTVRSPVLLGGGWNMHRHVVSPGDWTGDGISDVIGVTPAGDVYLYRGDGQGRFAPGRSVIGSGWGSFTDLVAPGDWDGDGHPDLLARKANGQMWLIPGNGSGGFASAPTLIGGGWQMFSQLITPGDLTGDGKVDLLGRTPAGKLYLYTGTGKPGPGCLPGRLIGAGWQMYNTVFSSGDITGDGKPDLIGRTAANASYVYAGNGQGNVVSRKSLTAPWGATTRIFGVR